jgi:cation diffusion facilitator family transporter
MARRVIQRGERAALIALVVTAVLAAAKIGVWAATSSLAVLSQALDSILDVVALLLVFLGVRIANKPADSEHHYGHTKAENLVAYTQTIFLVAVAIGVMAEGVLRLSESGSEPVSAPWYALTLLVVSALVDVVRVRLLLGAAKDTDSDALRAGALNFITDIGTAGAAIVSLLLVRGGFENADAIGGIVVAAAVLIAAIRLGRRSIDVLMDRAPGEPAEAITQAAERASGVAETRRVRVRGSAGRLFADVTVAAGRTTSLERAHDIAEHVEREIERIAPGIDVVVHVEPTSETTGLVERALAAASRVEGVHEVHNVSVHAFDDQGQRKLHVTLHAKIGPGTSLEQAHRLSDEIEGAVESELGGRVRVDSHIEPLEPTIFGKDVTPEHPKVIADVTRVALDEPDILDCHEVLVTSSNGELSIVAHVRGRRNLPLDRIHAASQRIEHTLHALNPDIGSVLIHFEPD